MEATEANRKALLAVLQFLKKNNLKEAENAFRQEAGLVQVSDLTSVSGFSESDADISAVLSEYESDGDPLKYEDYYTSLETFIENSLDTHKPELSLVLYPVFVHLYLELVYKGCEREAEQFFRRFSKLQEDYRQADLHKLSLVTKRAHMDTNNEVLSHFRSSKYVIRLSRESYGVLKKYMQEKQQELLLNLIQQKFHLDVFDGKPRSKRAIEASTGSITGEAPPGANKAKVFYGLIHDADLMATSDEDSEDEEDKEKPKKKKTKKEEGKKRQVADPNAPKADRIPFPKLKESEKTVLCIKHKEVSKRMHVGPEKVPSVCFYSVLNAGQSLNCVQFNDDSTMLSSGYGDSSIRIWSLTPKKLRTLKSTTDLAKIDKEAGDILERIMDDRTATEMKVLHGHSGPVYGLHFNLDNSFMLSSSEDGSVRLWSMHTFTNLVAYKGHNYPVWDVKFCPKGYYFASASYDKTARLWSTENHLALRVFAGHYADVNVVDFHPNCNYIATGSADRSVRIWDLLTGSCVRIFTGHKGSVQKVKFSPDGKHLVSSGIDKKVVLWDIAEGAVVGDFTGHSDAVYSLCFSREGHMLASGGNDYTVKLWDVKRAYAIDDEDDFGLTKTNNKGTSVSTFECASFLTKLCRIQTLHFTRHNLLLASGSFLNLYDR